MQLEKAIEILIECLNANPDYRHSWQANIAVCAQDEGVSHEVSNKAAKRFLDLLCYKGLPCRLRQKNCEP